VQTTPENLKLIEKKLSRFRNWSGFPKAREDGDRRIFLLCKLVRNKTIQEMEDEGIMRRSAPPELPPGVVPLHKPLPKDTNDLELLLTMVEETSEQFPSHAALRRLYGRYFTTPDDDMINAAAADLAGEVW